MAKYPTAKNPRDGLLTKEVTITTYVQLKRTLNMMLSFISTVLLISQKLYNLQIIKYHQMKAQYIY